PYTTLFRSDAELDDDGEQREAQRRREGAGEDLVDRLARVGRAEVALQHVAEIEEVARQEGLVEVELLLECRDLLGRRGAVAEHAQHGVARHREHHREDDERRPEEHRDALQQARDDVPDHRVYSVSEIRGERTPWGGAETPPHGALNGTSPYSDLVTL